MMKYLIFFLIFIPSLHAQQDTFIVSFGSCHKQTKSESDEIINAIAAEKPNMFIWLGDIVYGKDGDALDLTTKYKKLKNKSSYQNLLEQTNVLAIWDDHDYGIDNGDSSYKNKRRSLADFSAFTDIINPEEILKRGGAYQHYELEQNNIKISFTLLDNRFFRTPFLGEKRAGKVSNSQGELLGKQQWNWLENILKSSEADIHIFASGIQFLSYKHRFEKWSNYPEERIKFLSLLKKHQVKNPIFLSGDRHHSEVSVLKEKDFVLVDITSSGMTEAISWNRNEPNPYRLGDVITQNNYASLPINLDSFKANVAFKSVNGKTIASRELKLVN